MPSLHKPAPLCESLIVRPLAGAKRGRQPCSRMVERAFTVRLIPMAADTDSAYPVVSIEASRGRSRRRLGCLTRGETALTQRAVIALDVCRDVLLPLAAPPAAWIWRRPR
jgi:hypothetical protein